MDTIRVDISYRPLRIGWAVQAGDIEAFRSAVRLSYALWGGRFNPILIADHGEEANRLVDLFRVDVVSPVGDSDEIKTLPKKFPSLINPFLYDTLFVETSTEERKRSQVPRRLQPSRALRRSTRVEGTPRGSLYTSRRIA